MIQSNSGENLDQAKQEFWRFSCEFYGQPEVKGLLLCLQDDHQVNVNQVLLILWLSFKYPYRLLADDIVNIHLLSSVAQSWVEKVRGIRRELEQVLIDGGGRPDDNRLRNDLLETELKLEQNHQAELLRCLPWDKLNKFKASLKVNLKMVRTNLNALQKNSPISNTAGMEKQLLRLVDCWRAFATR